MSGPSINSILSQVVEAGQCLRKSPEFIIRKKLWQGYMKTGWIAKLVVVSAILMSYFFISGIVDVFTHDPSPEVAAQSTSVFMNKLSGIGNLFILSGTMKYIVLILMETMIFHFSVKTYEYLSGEKRELTINDFIHAEIRMIKVSIRSWIYELILGIIATVLLKLFGFDLLAKIVFFLIQCYFIGLAFIDNYNEQFGIDIKESFAITYQHLGAAVIVGVVAYTLFMIPLIGIVVTPFICAVATTFYMYHATEDQLSPSWKTE